MHNNRNLAAYFSAESRARRRLRWRSGCACADGCAQSIRQYELRAALRGSTVLWDNVLELDV